MREAIRLTNLERRTVRLPFTAQLDYLVTKPDIPVFQSRETLVQIHVHYACSRTDIVLPPHTNEFVAKVLAAE